MSIGSIGKTVVSTVKKAPKVALEETNKIGNFVLKNLPCNKDKVDQFVKTSSKVDKSTAVGAGVMAAILALAIGGAKSISNAVKHAKED